MRESLAALSNQLVAQWRDHNEIPPKHKKMKETDSRIFEERGNSLLNKNAINNQNWLFVPKNQNNEANSNFIKCPIQTMVPGKFNSRKQNASLELP